ncbi:hypothetical protein B9_00030 [Escherichia phage B9-1]|nr:hypothetical protein B9_00030 [Escherichia phage B9-1]
MPLFNLAKPVEAHQFDGSSSSVSDLQRWIDTGVFAPSPVRTRDILRMCELVEPFGNLVLYQGDWLVDFMGDWLVMSKEEMFKIFKEEAE